jgi:hypothetical protein
VNLLPSQEGVDPVLGEGLDGPGLLLMEAEVVKVGDSDVLRLLLAGEPVPRS